MAASLMQRSLAGIRWSAATQVVAQVAQYAGFIVLARTLAPAQYGTLASAMLVAGVLALIHEMGLGAALIQRPELARGHLAACLWTNVAVGWALAALVWLGAPAVAAFFRDPAVAEVLMALAIGFPIAAAGVLPRALLERELRFKALGLIEAGAAIANGALTIALALAGAGVWAMVAGSLAATTLQAGALWAVRRPAPGWRCTRGEVRDLLAFGGSVLGSRLAGYFIANVDYLIIGRLMGPAALGAYTLAYKLVTWPMLKISHVVLRVAFPAFARVEDDATFRAHYLRLVGTLALVSFPLLAGLALTAPELLPLVFGSHWADSIFVTQVLCGVGALKALVCSIGTVFLGRGRPDIELKLNVLGAVKLPLFILAGAPWGLPGVAIAMLISALTGVPFQQYFANRLIGLTWRAYLRGLAAPAAATATMAVAVGAWRVAAADVAPGASLAVAVPLGIVTYLAALSALGVDLPALARAAVGRRARPPADAPAAAA